MNRDMIFHTFVRYIQAGTLKMEGVAVADKEDLLFVHHFTPERERNIYSHTKSYTATAAGLAIQEGLLSLDTTLAELFPDKLPPEPDPRLLRINLRNLLTMSSGFGEAYLMMNGRRRGEGFPDYLTYMLNRPIKKTPGSCFDYSTADSILAGRMVEQVSGQKLSHFLYERLFSRLDQGFPIWESCPEGHPLGGGGLFMTLTNMLKLGQLYLNNGSWKGEKLITPEWIKVCGTKQIETSPDSSDIWRCGYGYQFWLSPYPDAYRADGAFGQISLILPSAGLIVACQCPEEGDFTPVRQALHEHLILPLLQID